MPGSRGAVPLRRTPVVLSIAPALPDLKVPRMHPCQARGVGPGAIECGHTPASHWLRWCLNGHERECWLCGVHSLMLAAGQSCCSECLARSVKATAFLKPLDLLLAGHATQPRTRAVLLR